MSRKKRKKAKAPEQSLLNRVHKEPPCAYANQGVPNHKGQLGAWMTASSEHMKMELTGISLLCLADTRHARKAVKSGIKSDFQKVIPSIEKKDEDFSIFSMLSFSVFEWYNRPYSVCTYARYSSCWARQYIAWM